MTYILYLIGLAAISLLWLKIKSYLLNRKGAILSEQLQGDKKDATKKVDDANAAYSEFEQRMQHYESDDGNGKPK